MGTIRSFLTKGLHPDDIKSLNESLRDITLNKDYALTKTNQKPEGVYFLPASSVNIQGNDQKPTDSKSVAATGINALILDQAAKLDLVTNTETEACYMAANPFRKLLKQTEWFPRQLLRVLVADEGTEFTSNHFIHQEKYLKLEKLVEASRILNSTLDLNQLLNIILDTSLNSVNGDRGTVYLIDEDSNELWSKVLEGSKKVTIRLPVGVGIAGLVAATGQTLNIPDAQKDDRFNPEVDKKTGYKTKSILCMPLKNKDGKILGVFQLLNKRNGVFNTQDERFIEALSIHAAIAIENARLYEQEQKKIAMEKEMLAAAQVQRSLFPTSIPELPGYLIYATNIPAQDVSGDLYDFISLDDNTLFFTLGDVSGKGLPAAILMANLQSVMRDLPFQNSSPGYCANRINNMINRSSATDKFVTLFMGHLNPVTHTLTFTNAGHDFPYVYRRDGRRERLESTGIPIGMLADFPYTENSIVFEPGDTLLVYSDGIVDAADSEGREFGEERMAERVAASTDKDPEAIVQILAHELTGFIGKTPQFDDMTLMVIKRMQ